MKTDVEFIKFVKEEIASYVNKHLDKSDNKVCDTNEVYIVSANMKRMA